MLHKTKSKRAALLKYGLSVPLLVAMLIFSSNIVKSSDYFGRLKNTAQANLQKDPGTGTFEYYKLFLKRNPKIKDMYWSKAGITIELKDGKKEIYDLKNQDEIKKAEVKYGRLPSLAPPPAIPVKK